MRIALLYLLLGLGSGAFAQKVRLEVRPIRPDYWVHTTYNDYRGTPFPSNGLIVEMGDSVLIVDTGWGIKQTKLLLRWVKKNLKKPVKLLIVTHSHEDRAGGIFVFQKQKIPIAMSKRTAELLKKEGVQVPDYQDIADQTDNNNLPYECFYPGRGHTSDNIVVYFKQAQLLFGGCFIKSMEANGMGNIADADLKEWPVSIQRVQNRFSQVSTIIPGHQAWGDATLLQHTLQLLETAPK